MVMQYHTYKQSLIIPFYLSGLKLFALFLFLFLVLQSSPLWAEVTASTGRTVMSIDETITLEITSKNGSGEPDLSLLENDFQLLGRSQSQNYSLINGQSSRTHTWSISLLPKRTGEITIPAIKVGNESTQPIHLVIQKQSSDPGLDGKDVFLKIELSDNDKLYVQQQIIVKVQLFHRVRFTNARLSELELDNTVVEKLGNDSNYNKVIANHRYNVVERNYAIYPQQSGSLTIPSLTFSGNAEISQSFSLFSRPGKQIISRTKPVTLEILPIPKSYTGKYWLPAKKLHIESEILEDTDAIKAGEAVTRHIVLKATNLLGSQLPANTMTSSASFKVYPDKEKINNQFLNGEVFGNRRDTIAIIPIKSGPFTFPEIKINWWNTDTNQQETSTLPARTLFAQKNIDFASSDEADKQAATSRPEVDKKAIDSEKTPEQIIDKVTYKELPITKNLWFWISMGLFIIWLITLLLFFTSRSKNNPPESKKQKPRRNQNEKNLQRFNEACHANDPHKTSQALIQWAKYYFKQPMLSGLSEIIGRIDNEHLISEITNLEKSQYSVNKHSWDGAALHSAMQHFIEQDKLSREELKQSSEQAFVPLNP